MIHIWNFEELSKIVGLEVILDGWCNRVTFIHEDEDCLPRTKTTHKQNK